MSADGGAAQRASCGRDLLAVLLDGGRGVEPQRAAQLAACVRRMPAPPAPPSLRQLAARLAAHSRQGDVHRALRQALAPARLRIPDVEGAAADRCSLCRAPHGRRFADASLQRHCAALFAAAAAGAPAVGASLALSRYDLFHGHLFVSERCVGVLLHAREYPARSAAFDEHLGYCQSGSPLAWDADAMALRNVLYVIPAGAAAPALALLHTAPGTLLHAALLHPAVARVHTIYEEDLGTPLADLNYLHAAQRSLPEHRLYVCA
jgi:hypothetical protein